MRIIGVNGIHSFGHGSTDRVLRLLASRYGYETVDFDYESVNFLQARKRSVQRDIGKSLANESEKGDVLIAHSFGCLVALRAMEQNAQFSLVVMLSAAMNNDFTFPYLGMDRLINVYNPADRALWLARFFRWADLGDMGAGGYRGAVDPRIFNHKSFSNEHGTLNHGHYFLEPTLSNIVELTHHNIKRLHNV